MSEWSPGCTMYVMITKFFPTVYICMCIHVYMYTCKTPPEKNVEER